jgi:peroxiredoxin
MPAAAGKLSDRPPFNNEREGGELCATRMVRPGVSPLHPAPQIPHVRAFPKKQKVTIPLAFDPGCRVRGKFGTLGFPSIVVIDRTGQVRLIRQGYNPAETTFRRDFVRFLETL